MRNKLSVVIYQYLWDCDLSNSPVWKIWVYKVARFTFILAKDISEGQLTLRAMSLVFTTLLALVPLLAVSFSVLKAFGVHNQIEPILLQFLQPLGEKSVDITGKIIGFVDNIKAGVLGSVGLAFLFYTVISLIQKVENAFNFIWQLEQNRSVLRRFSDYLSVLIVGPVLVFSALGISATLLSTDVIKSLVAIQPLGYLFETVMRLVPYVLIIAAFSFIYVFIPNTRVQLRAAIIAGFVSGVVWQSVGWLFGSFVVSSANYTAIYSGFAIMIFFMIWIYLNWMILLIGGSIAFYVQHPESMVLDRSKLALSIYDKEKLSLEILVLIGRAFYSKTTPYNIRLLAQQLRVPQQVVDRLVEPFLHAGYLQEAGEEESLLPGVPYEDTLLKDVINTIRLASTTSVVLDEKIHDIGDINRVLNKLDNAGIQVLDNMVLKDLLSLSD